jgi:hypothetical protein
MTLTTADRIAAAPGGLVYTPRNGHAVPGRLIRWWDDGTGAIRALVDIAGKPHVIPAGCLYGARRAAEVAAGIR